MVAVMSEDYLGFWQCKLRYRTQDEVLQVARRYKEMGIHLDVIVIDFFHWPRQGDWCFDKEYWPDPKAMCDELHAMGTKVMVSVWPSVDKKCSHFYEMQDKGYLVRTEHGSNQTYDFNGDCLTFYATNPEARQYLWDICKKNYADYGIDMFWLDNSEPDLNVYDFGNYRYQIGNGLQVANIYPKLYSQAFYDGMKAAGYKNFVNLERCAWVGSQTLSQVLWNGDVQSSWECLQDSIVEGLNIGLAGIPWWTTDIGGFMYGDPSDKGFVELLPRCGLSPTSACHSGCQRTPLPTPESRPLPHAVRRSPGSGNSSPHRPARPRVADGWLPISKTRSSQTASISRG